MRNRVYNIEVIVWYFIDSQPRAWNFPVLASSLREAQERASQQASQTGCYRYEVGGEDAGDGCPG